MNDDPYGDGWMVRVKMDNSGEVDGMLTPEEYEEYLKSEE